MPPGSPSLPGLYIPDAEGARLWREAFGEQRVAVAFPELFAALEERIAMPLTAAQRDNLRFVLDDAGCKLLTVFRCVASVWCDRNVMWGEGCGIGGVGQGVWCGAEGWGAGGLGGWGME
jgi:hypothetical protein